MYLALWGPCAALSQINPVAQVRSSVTGRIFYKIIVYWQEMERLVRAILLGTSLVRVRMWMYFKIPARLCDYLWSL